MGDSTKLGIEKRINKQNTNSDIKNKAPTSGLVSCARFGSWQKCPGSFWVHAWKQTQKLLIVKTSPQKEMRAGDCECALCLRFKRCIISTIFQDSDAQEGLSMKGAFTEYRRFLEGSLFFIRAASPQHGKIMSWNVQFIRVPVFVVDPFRVKLKTSLGLQSI